MKKILLLILISITTILSSCGSSKELENGTKNLKEAESYKLEITMYKGNDLYKENIVLHYYDNHFYSNGDTSASFHLVSLSDTEIIYFMLEDGVYKPSNTLPIEKLKLVDEISYLKYIDSIIETDIGYTYEDTTNGIDISVKIEDNYITNITVYRDDPSSTPMGADEYVRVRTEIKVSMYNELDRTMMPPYTE